CGELLVLPFVADGALLRIVRDAVVVGHMPRMAARGDEGAAVVDRAVPVMTFSALGSIGIPPQRPAVFCRAAQAGRRVLDIGVTIDGAGSIGGARCMSAARVAAVIGGIRHDIDLEIDVIAEAGDGAAVGDGRTVAGIAVDSAVIVADNGIYDRIDVRVMGAGGDLPRRGAVAAVTAGAVGRQSRAPRGLDIRG